MARTTSADTGLFKALLAGKDVFVEKPLALRVPEAEELVELARKKKRVLMVGYTFTGLWVLGQVLAAP